MNDPEVDSLEHDPYPMYVSEVDPELYPRLSNMSAGFIYNGIIRPDEPELPEYISVPMGTGLNSGIELQVGVSQWNTLWEAAQFRRRYFDEDELVEPLKTLADQGDCNFILVPRTSSRYYEYAPLFHMLSARKLEQFGLPLLRKGQWPFQMALGDVDRYLPHDFENRLANAWASTIWPHLVSGSSLGAFSANDPLKLLAHNLDYWIPPVTSFMQDVLRDFSLVKKDVEIPSRVALSDGSFLEGATAGFPRMGGDIWTGEAEAAEAVRLTVETADSTGQLRGIIDTIRSHRAHDDFSPRWSHAREDFERKINHSRAKVKVSFIELPDTIPVQGPETEVVGSIVTADFLTLLDPKEREIVVLLTSGFTRQTEIAEKLGYTTHSAVSKRLAKIRKKAGKYFD